MTKRSWGTPTDGPGTRTTAHLNLTRSLADLGWSKRVYDVRIPPKVRAIIRHNHRFYSGEK